MKIQLAMVAVCASIAGCVVFAYLWIDCSITLSYVKQSAETSDAARRHLERLLEGTWNDMPEGVVLEKLRMQAARYPAENIVLRTERGVIWFDETKFSFEKGRLKSIGEN